MASMLLHLPLAFHLMLLFHCILFLGIFLFWSAQAQEPTVNTPYGDVRGFKSDSANVFLGIPFAKPPTGDLRLEKPVKVDPWSGVLEAKEYRSACVPNLLIYGISGNFSEDCLFLNIITPEKILNGPYPVLAFMPGGAFQVGSAAKYNYTTIIENFVSKGIVFVSLQYRLGPFGFITTKDDVLPGNLGLWDQKLALDFLHEVLPSFGGDVQRITVGGDSSGAASVSALSISPHSRDSFAKALQISGSIFAGFAMYEDTNSEEFMVLIGCDPTNSTEAKDCLKQKSVEDFVDAQKMMEADFNQLLTTAFHPRIDGDFFPEDVYSLIKASPKKPTITGVNDKEMGGFVLTGYGENYIEVPKSEWNLFDLTALKEKLRITAQNISGLGDLLEAHYSAGINSSESQNYSLCLERHIQSISDIHMVVPLYQEVMAKLHSQWPIYVYVESFFSQSPDKMELPVKGSFHTNEMPYLLGSEPRIAILDDTSSREFRKNFAEAIASFVKQEHPSVGSTQWTPVSLAPDNSTSSFDYLSLDVSCEMKKDFMGESVRFWSETVAIGVDNAELRTLFPFV